MAEKAGFLERRLAGEQQTLARPLCSLVQKPPVVCREHQSIREVVGLMHARKVGSVVVVDELSRPLGIFTTKDLVAAATRDLDLPVAEVMSRPAVALPADAMAYEAALAMIGMQLRHVLVTEDGKLIGVVSERDLFSLQRLGLGEITTEIRLAGRIELLGGIAAEIRRLTRLLVEEGVAAEQLTRFVSTLNDRLSQRIIEIERKHHRWEQIGWCWLAFGSEGRFEQTFTTDQDNGLVFSAHDGTTPDSVRKRLLPFARSVNEALDACGFPLCKGNIMASNPRLCLSLDEWLARVRGWVETPVPEALLDAAICFDFRPLAGDATLASALRDQVHLLTRSNPAFLRHMADNALLARPPLGKLRDFATEDAPNAPHTLNLKLYGARPFVDAARIYALAQGLSQTSTGERLRAARARAGMEVAETEAIVQAFYFIQSLRLRKQAALDNLADESANRVDPDTLNELDRHILKGSFNQSRRLQSRLALDYQI